MTASPLSQPGPSPVMERHPDLARLVTLFYDRARNDALIGPVFSALMRDWDGHLRTMTAFWATQLRGRGTYRSQPVAAHVAMACHIAPAMFDRWLDLWRDTATEVMAPEEAVALIGKATQIAATLSRAVEAAKA